MIKWKTLSTETVFDCPIFRIRSHRRRSPRNHKENAFFTMATFDWIQVIPVTAAGELVMVRQYRHGTDDFTVELPAGVISDADETPREAARRELVEETGYVADRWEPFGTVHPNPAIQENSCHLFIAHGVSKAHEQALDDFEDIAVEVMPLDRVKRLIRDNTLTHAIALSALCRYLNRIEQLEGGD